MVPPPSPQGTPNAVNLIKPSATINSAEREPGKRIKDARALVLRCSLAFSPPEEGFQGIGGRESEMERGLGRKRASWLWDFFSAGIASHSLRNSQTGIKGGAVHQCCLFTWIGPAQASKGTSLRKKI